MNSDISAFLQQIEDIKAARPPLEALSDAAMTLGIIRNAMDMLANDPEGLKNLLPWQRNLFTKAHAHIADVVETLHKVHRDLCDKESPAGAGP
jgi:hypothetical protein